MLKDTCPSSISQANWNSTHWRLPISTATAGILSRSSNSSSKNLTFKHLLGCSENAVKIYLWTAIITYLLLARVKALYKSPYSITEIATLVRVYGLVRMDLGQLITSPQPLIPNQDVNELTLF